MTSVPCQRTLHDFFTSSDGSTVKQPTAIHAEPETQNQDVPGLSIIPSFVTPAEESNILNFLSTQLWRTDLARRTIHYGGTYCLMPPRNASAEVRKKIESTIFTADPLPIQLNGIVERLVAEHELYYADSRPEFCIVNEYIANQGISAHVENFRFGEPVCALSLGDGAFIRFHELVEEDAGSVRSGKARLAKRTGTQRDVWLPGRSLMVMRGEARRKWQHEIVRSWTGRREGFRRVSLTFRVEEKKKRKDE